MSDLNVGITAEDQEAIEQKLVYIMGEKIINSYGSISNELISKLLTADKKPEGIEKLLAAQEIYGNAVKKLFNINQDVIDAEKVILYKDTKLIIDGIEQQLIAQIPDSNVTHDESTDATVSKVNNLAAENITDAIEKVEKAVESAKESINKTEKNTRTTKKKSPAKKSSTTKSTKETSVENN